MFDNLKKWWNYEPPDYATSEEWNAHDRSFRENAPIRYFLNETLSKYYMRYCYHPIVSPVKDRVHKIMCRILPWRQHNVIRIKTHGATWHDKDYVMLHGMFALLVDFVEVEKAWMECLSDEGKLRKMPWYKRPFFRSRELGLKYLDDEAMLDQDPQSQLYGNPAWDADGNPSQAESARQQRRLYLWWKDDYLKRVDPYEMELTTAELLKLETERFNEEQEALQMLVKIRAHLWT
jgi:hypothetical protein